MSTVGGVNELAVGMNQNFGGGIKGFSCFHFFTDGGSGGNRLAVPFLASHAKVVTDRLSSLSK